MLYFKYGLIEELPSGGGTTTNITGNISAAIAPSSPHTLNLKAGVGSSASITPASPHTIILKAGVGSAVVFSPASPSSFVSGGSVHNVTGNIPVTYAPSSPHKITLKAGVGSSATFVPSSPHALNLKGGVGSSVALSPASPHALSLKAGVGSSVTVAPSSPHTLNLKAGIGSAVSITPASPHSIVLKAGVGSAVRFTPASPASFGGAVTTSITGNISAAVALASPYFFRSSTTNIQIGNIPIAFGITSSHSFAIATANISADVVNEALQLIGDDGPLVTGVAPTFDSSAAGKAAAKVYVSTVTAVARQSSWDFARQNVLLQPSGNSPPFLWAYEYVYPANCIQLWQVSPTALLDPNNPQPIGWAVGNSIINGTQTKVIWTNLQNARAVYNSNPPESIWDPLFRQTVVRMLAAKLASALAGKPDTSQSMMDTAGAFQSIGRERDS